MAKNKPTLMNEERIKQQPTIYTFNFKDVPADKYTEVLKVLFANPDFAELVEKRNTMVRSVERMRPNSQELLSLIKNIQQRDHKLADLLYAALVQTNLHADETYDFFSFTTLLKYYVNYSKPGMKDNVDRLARNLDSITFLSDMLESLLVDVKSDMRTIFGRTIEFNQFDAVAQVLTQLRGFFKSSRSGDSESSDAQLYFEYSDSINDYLAKRLKTYTDKYRKKHPAPPAYTERDMIDALNQFFGSDTLFGSKFIKHTESGGSYIDASVLAVELNNEQIKKMTKLVGQIKDKDVLKYSFEVTDAIMSQYKKPK